MSGRCRTCGRTGNRRRSSHRRRRTVFSSPRFWLWVSVTLAVILLIRSAKGDA